MVVLALSLDLFAAGLVDAHLLAVGQHLDPDAVGLGRRRVVDGDVGLLDRHGLVDHAAGGALHRVRLDVLLDHVHAFDGDAVIIDTRDHRAALALVAAGQHDDLVALANLVHDFRPSSDRPSEHFGSQRHDLHEALGAQLARHRTEDAGADRLQLGVQQHGSIAVELDQRAILATHALGGAHHNRAVDLALLDAAARRSFLDADLDDVADARIAALGPAEHLDAHDGLGTRVVGDIESRLHLNHVCPQLLPPPQG